MKKIIILGNGQLGSYLYKKMKDNFNYSVEVVDYPEFDICNKDQCNEVVENNDIIINCAAYTNVDKAETEFEKCFNINTFGVKNLIDACIKNGGKKLIHISSEAVFGSDDNDYKPLTEEDERNPKNIYSFSKKLAEDFFAINNHRYTNYLILRSGWLFGPDNDHNFIEKIKKLMMSKEEIKVVDDQIGSLTSVNVIYNCIIDYLNGCIENGIYNAANAGYASRYECAKFVKEKLNLKCNIISCTSNEFKRTANVAKNSCLDIGKLLMQNITFDIPSWKEDVEKVLKGEL